MWAADQPAQTDHHLLGVPLSQTRAGHCSWPKAVLQNEGQALRHRHLSCSRPSTTCRELHEGGTGDRQGGLSGKLETLREAEWGRHGIGSPGVHRAQGRPEPGRCAPGGHRCRGELWAAPGEELSGLRGFPAEGGLAGEGTAVQQGRILKGLSAIGAAACSGPEGPARRARGLVPAKPGSLAPTHRCVGKPGRLLLPRWLDAPHRPRVAEHDPHLGVVMCKVVLMRSTSERGRRSTKGRGARAPGRAADAPFPASAPHDRTKSPVKGEDFRGKRSSRAEQLIPRSRSGLEGSQAAWAARLPWHFSAAAIARHLPERQPHAPAAPRWTVLPLATFPGLPRTFLPGIPGLSRRGRDSLGTPPPFPAPRPQPRPIRPERLIGAGPNSALIGRRWWGRDGGGARAGAEVGRRVADYATPRRLRRFRRLLCTRRRVPAGPLDSAAPQAPAPTPCGPNMDSAGQGTRGLGASAPPPGPAAWLLQLPGAGPRSLRGPWRASSAPGSAARGTGAPEAAPRPQRFGFRAPARRPPSRPAAVPTRGPRPGHPHEDAGREARWSHVRARCGAPWVAALLGAQAAQGLSPGGKGCARAPGPFPEQTPRSGRRRRCGVGRVAVVGGGSRPPSFRGCGGGRPGCCVHGAARVMAGLVRGPPGSECVGSGAFRRPFCSRSGRARGARAPGRWGPSRGSTGTSAFGARRDTGGSAGWARTVRRASPGPFSFPE